MNMLVLGGDERLAHLARAAREAGWCVTARYPDDAPEKEAEAKAECENWDVAVLPYPFCQRDGALVAPRCAYPVSMQEAAQACRYARHVVGSGAREWIEKAIDPLDDPAFVLENAYLTAEGAVFCAMRDSEDCIAGANCLVLGCGRIARFLSQRLNAWEAAVTVTARKEADRAFARAQGWRAIGFERHELAKALEEADAVFNTVPYPVLDEPLLGHIKKGAHLYELASAPYGFSMETAKKLGIHAHLESGLPGKYAPSSAAQALLRCIERLMKEGEAHA